jgi:hypothetical protein
VAVYESGYLITPALYAAAEAIRVAVAAKVPAFADACLAVIMVHW